jgi:hypothetical protein
MTTTLTTTQRTTVRLNAITDRKGHPARIDGKPSWAADNDLLILEPADDGLSCRVTSAGTTGSCTVTITADADLGEGVRNLTHSEFFSIIDAPATNIDVAIDAPEEVEEAPAPE